MVRRCGNRWRRLVRDTRGLTTVEYIIILCLIALVGIAAWTSFGQSVGAKVSQAGGVVDGLPTAATTAP